MTDKNLTTLTAGSGLAATDLLYGLVGANSRKISLTTLGVYLATATLAAGTITTSQPMTLTQTWNDGAVTFTAFKINATSTASAAASLLADFQVGGVTKASITKAGKITTTSAGGGVSSAGAPDISFNGTTNGLFGDSGGNGVGVTVASNIAWLCDGTSFRLRPNNPIAWAPDGFVASDDTIIGRAAAASIQFGATDAAAPVAQTLGVQSVVAGTSNTAGALFIIAASKGTGTGVGGDIAVKTAPAGTTGTSQNALATALTIKGSGSVVIGNAALATTATDGFLYVETCAGAPTGVPTAFTGRAALVYDSTNNKLYVYNGAWKGVTLA